MVDTTSLFLKLGAGAKFDFKRFGKDLERVQPSITVEREHAQGTAEALDFFGESRHCVLDSKGGESDLSGEVQGDKATPMVIKDKKRKGKRKGKQKDTDKNPLLMNGLKESEKENEKQGGQSKETMTRLHVEKMQVLRGEHSIHVGGSDIPDPMPQFDELRTRFNVSEYILKAIQESGYKQPTPIQMQAVPVMIEKRELLACAPTGSGKTLAFIIPILHRLKKPKREGFRAVVVSPTRELAQQIYREFCRMNTNIGFKIHVLTKAKASSNSFGPNTSKRFDILITTPNRLVHLLQQDPPKISLSRVECLVLDEGDKLFEDGKQGFRDQVATIYQACDNPAIQRTLFSATLANDIEQWCKLHLDNPVCISIGAKNSATSTVEQELLFVGQESGKLLAVRDIFRKGFLPPILVFVQSKERSKELFNELIYDGINVDVIHADRTQAQRDNVVKSFRTGKIWVLIATELMGRGIDFKGVNLVINYDFPPTAVSYIHRIGRTGRAGRPGRAITFFTEDDVVNLRSIANVMKASGCDIPDWMLKVKKPSRKTKKKLKKAPIAREHIRTVSKYDLQTGKRKREIIEASRRKKRRSESEDGQT